MLWYCACHWYEYTIYMLTYDVSRMLTRYIFLKAQKRWISVILIILILGMNLNCVTFFSLVVIIFYFLWPRCCASISIFNFAFLFVYFVQCFHTFVYIHPMSPETCLICVRSWDTDLHNSQQVIWIYDYLSFENMYFELAVLS